MDLLKIYETFTIDGKEITIGEFGFGYIKAYHNNKEVASAYTTDNIVGSDDDYVLMNINILDDYNTVELHELMFKAAEFYYGDFMIEENFHQNLTNLSEISHKDFKHLPFATTTNEIARC